jgi:BON domain
LKKLIAIAGAIGGVVYFFDREQGGARRARLQAKLGGLLGRRGASSDFASGRSDSVQAVHRKAPNDVTLAQKVESELFRGEAVPKGQINVNAQDGVVQLRGEVPNEDLIGDLVEKARSVQGVLDVENLLHTPGQPAPMHQ